MLEDFIKAAKERISKIEGIKRLYILSNDLEEISMVTLLLKDDKSVYYEVYKVEEELMREFPEIEFDNYVTEVSEKSFNFSKATQLI